MTTTNTQYALQEGIKLSGIGKKGSKDIPCELIDPLLRELKDPGVPPAIKGAFIGGLLMKGVTDNEKPLEEAFTLNNLSKNAPSQIYEICTKLLDKKTLSKAEAKDLGDFLFSDAPASMIHGLVASILRVRYETDDEYEGLLESIKQTFNPNLTKRSETKKPIVQLVEPFDGVARSYMITPLIAEHLQRNNYHVASLLGRSSGPKSGNNLYTIAKELNASFLKNGDDLIKETPSYGWYLDQKDLSAAMDRWVDIRRQIIKRPFLATIERFVNPLNADILIASAFHPAYGHKMLEIAKRQNFSKILIIRNGMEGGLGFALKRPVKVLCARKNKQGTYDENEFNIHAEKKFNQPLNIEERLENPDLNENVRLITTYAKNQSTDYALFDLRVKATCAGLDQGLEYVNHEA